jgi:MOSC domain-containing protein YiiM
MPMRRKSPHYIPLARLRAGLGEIKAAPKDSGPLELIVRRPAVDEREVLDTATIDEQSGLVGDNWLVRGSSTTPDGSAHPSRQVTVMNARAISLVAGTEDRWCLAGDQLYVDFDLSPDNIPPGTLLRVGSVVLEVSDQPHLGCAKFAARFGTDALKFVNSPEGVSLNLRGINVRVVEGGTVSVGDQMTKLVQAASDAAAAPIRSRKLSQ